MPYCRLKLASTFSAPTPQLETPGLAVFLETCTCHHPRHLSPPSHLAKVDGVVLAGRQRHHVPVGGLDIERLMDGVALALDVQRQPRRLLLDVAHHVVVDGFLETRRERGANLDGRVGRDGSGARLELDHRLLPGAGDELCGGVVRAAVERELEGQVLGVDES